MKPLLTILALAALISSSFAYSSGPPDNRCGNPPNNAYCTQCHSTFALNSGDGSVVLSGLPIDGFVPNQVYPLTVTITDPGQQRWGFEITAEYQSGSNWLQAGNFTITQSSFTQLSVGSGTAPDFVKHTSDGTFPGTAGPHSWQFNWTAPASTVNSVNFYLAGNAANGNGGSNGDYIYGNSVTLNQYIPPPPVVDDLVIAISGNNVVLSWSPYTIAISYKIYRSTEPYFNISGLTPLAIVTVPQYTDINAGVTDNYFYKVTTVTN